MADIDLANDELLASWMLSLHAKQPRTKLFYSGEVARFVTWLTDRALPAGEPGDLVAVSRRDIEAWLTDLRAEGRADATIRSRWVALRNLYGWLLVEEEITSSPLAKVVVAKGEPPAIQVLGDDQLGALLAACKGQTFYDRRDLAMVRLFVATGLRVSELVAIDLADLDLATRLLVVRHPKGGKRTRVVRFDAATAASLDRYKRIRARHHQASSPKLFLGYRGPLSRKGVPVILDKRAKLAGIGHVHPHQLRHCWAHRWLAAGGNEGDLQKLGGWTNGEVMARYGGSMAVERALSAYDTVSPMGRL